MSRRPNLNRKLLLEDPARIADGAGGFAETWSPLGQLWAQVTPRSGREAQDGSVVRYRILTRHAPHDAPSRPKPEQRFRDGERIYRIEAVTEAPELGRYLICYATEETGG